MTTVRLISLLIAVCFAGAAQAQVAWSVPGSACVPASPSVAVGNYQTVVPAVQFATGKIGQIVLICQIERFDSGTGSWTLAMRYRDSTGTATAASAVAQVFRVPFNASPIVLTTANSNSSANTGDATVFSVPFNHMFNFNTDIYFARVILTRNATSQIVVFHSLRLQSAAISDIRLKHDIALLGRLDNGLGFYRFSYNGDDKTYVGVMAQEVEAIRPDAVVRGEDGYLRVFYDRIGLRMQTWKEWVAAGQKLPATGSLIQAMMRD